VVCGVAWHRNLGKVREAIDRALGLFALKVSIGCGLATMVIWGLSVWLSAPQTGFGNFIYLCITCGAGGLAYLLVLMVSGILSLSQVRMLFERPAGS